MFQGYKQFALTIAYQNINVCHFAANILKLIIYLLMAFGFFSKIGNNRRGIELWYPEFAVIFLHYFYSKQNYKFILKNFNFQKLRNGNKIYF
jgi:hypothetical protein